MPFTCQDLPKLLDDEFIISIGISIMPVCPHRYFRNAGACPHSYFRIAPSAIDLSFSPTTYFKNRQNGLGFYNGPRLSKSVSSGHLDSRPEAVIFYSAGQLPFRTCTVEPHVLDKPRRRRQRSSTRQSAPLCTPCFEVVRTINSNGLQVR